MGRQKKLKLNKRRVIVLIIAVIILFLLIFGLVKLFSSIFKKEVSYGNLSNKGYAMADGGTVYYNKYDSGIVKVKGGKEYQISDESASCITLYKGKIYYISSSFNLMCVNTNGDELTKIKALSTTIEKFYIEDDYVYYTRIGETRTGNSNIGISKFPLNDITNDTYITAANVKDFILDRDKIYFTDNVGFLYSVSTSGSDRTTLCTDYGIGNIQLKGKWIYFYDSKENALCKVKKDGTGKSTVATFVNNETFNVTNKNIYYLDKVNNQICKCDLNGKKSKPVVSIKTGATKISVVNGIIYYLDESKDPMKLFQMYRVKTNGRAAAEIVY